MAILNIKKSLTPTLQTYKHHAPHDSIVRLLINRATFSFPQSQISIKESKILFQTQKDHIKNAINKKIYNIHHSCNK